MNITTATRGYSHAEDGRNRRRLSPRSDRRLVNQLSSQFRNLLSSRSSRSERGYGTNHSEHIPTREILPKFPGRFENMDTATHQDVHERLFHHGHQNAPFHSSNLHERLLGTSRVDYISFIPQSRNTPISQPLHSFIPPPLDSFKNRRSSLQEHLGGVRLHADLDITPPGAGGLAYYSRRGSDSKYVAPNSLGIYQRSFRSRTPISRSHSPIIHKSWTSADAYRFHTPVIPDVSTFSVKNKTMHLKNTKSVIPPLVHVFANRLLGIRSPWKLPTKSSAARNNIQQIVGFFTLLERLSDHCVDPESLPTFYNNVYSIAKYMFNRTTRRHRRRIDSMNDSSENVVHIGDHVYDIGEYGNKSVYQKYVLLDMCTDSTLASEFYDSFNRQILEHRTNYRSLPSIAYILDFVECVAFWIKFSSDTFVVLNYPGHGFNVLLLFACAIFSVDTIQEKEYTDNILDSLEKAILDSFSWRNNCRIGTPEEQLQEFKGVNRNDMESVPSLLEMISWPASYRRYLHYFIALKDAPRTANVFRIKHILLNSLLPGVDFAVEVYSLGNVNEYPVKKGDAHNENSTKKATKRRYSERNVRRSCTLYSPLLFPRCVCGGEANDGVKMVSCEGDYHVQMCPLYNDMGINDHSDKKRYNGSEKHRGYVGGYPDSTALLVDFTVGADGEPRELLVQGDVTIALVLHAKRASRKILATFSFNTAFVNGDAIEVHKSELDIWDPEFPLIPHSRLFIYVEKKRDVRTSKISSMDRDSSEVVYKYPSGSMETFLKYHVAQVDEEDVKSLVRTFGCSSSVCRLALKVCKKYSDALELLTSEEMQALRDVHDDHQNDHSAHSIENIIETHYGHQYEHTGVPRIETRLSIHDDSGVSDTAVSDDDVIVDSVRTFDDVMTTVEHSEDVVPERGESISSPHFETSREEALSRLPTSAPSKEQVVVTPEGVLKEGTSPSTLAYSVSPDAKSQECISPTIVSRTLAKSSSEMGSSSSASSMSVSSVLDASTSPLGALDPFIQVKSSDSQGDEPISPGISISPSSFGGASLSLIHSPSLLPLDHSSLLPLDHSSLPQFGSSSPSRVPSALMTAVSPGYSVKSPGSSYQGSVSSSSEYIPCIDIEAVVQMEEKMKEEEVPVTLDELKGALKDELQKKLKRKGSDSSISKSSVGVSKIVPLVPKSKMAPPVPKEKKAPPVPKIVPLVPKGKTAPPVPKGKTAPPVPKGKMAPPLPKGKVAPKLPLLAPKAAKRALPLGIKLHWKPLSNTRLEGTIFEAIKHGGHSDKDLFDVNTATKLFTRQAKQVIPKRIHVVSTLAVLDAKRAQNIGIVLRFPEGVYDLLLDDVDRLNTDSPNVTLENLDKLTTAMPTELERDRFTKYLSNTTGPPLQPLEKDVVKLMKKDMEAKIRISKFTIQYKSAVEVLKSQLDIFETAIEQIRGSVHLPILLSAILQYGNFVNHGNTEVKTYGFTISSAIRLVDLKSSDKSITSLHYLMINLATRFPDKHFNEIDVSLENVLLAEKVSAKGILDTLEEVRTELGFLVKFSEKLNGQAEDGGEDLLPKVNRIIEECKDGLCDVTARQQRIFEGIKETWKFLGEEHKQGMALEEIFQILADLAKSVKKVFTDIKNRPNKFLVAISDEEERALFLKRFVEKKSKLT